MMAADLLTVNEFTFCAEHGDEYCSRCTYDFRYINNYAILNELDQQIVEVLSDVSIIFSSQCTLFIQTSGS